MQTSPRPTASTWPHPDNAMRYGSISRMLHWAMVISFAVVFFAALAHYFVEDSSLDAVLWPLHKPFGALLMLLGLVRVLWAIAHRRQTPPPISGAARWGHGLLYALMLSVPAIALLRQYGSGRAFAPFGIPLMQDRPGEKIDWMTQLGGLLHGELGWVLLAAVCGHIALALWHRRSPSENVLPRMWG
ncbi:MULTISPECIES: cytochrome b/b6 domain-containing protein [unclassified Acidovorax]|uniref:cytochrome b n=1 Tax=unclassified Acidovorax TaxID=2684926 RepID=UPI0028833222|nr:MULTISPECIES: cytochrome b/b6 domain-containing protein [unclassified Acidovorax]